MAGKKAISNDDDDIAFENDRDGGLYRDRADDEDNEDDDALDSYEKDGFIVDDVEEVDDEDDHREKQKKKKRKKREIQRNYLLDEDDYELLQESNISVPCRNLEGKKLKRLKKAHGDAKEEPSQFSGEGQYTGREKEWLTAEERLKYRLFGDDDGQSLEDIDEEDELKEEGTSIAEEDEMADFIVDEDQEREHGASVRRKKPPKSMQQSGISASALQEAHAIFGDVEELLKSRKLEMGDRFCETGERSLEDQFDPTVLSEKYMTRKDDQIRETDIPERIQIFEESTGHPPTDEISIKVEVEWIYNQLVSGVVPFFGRTSIATEELDELKGHIAKFLELMHVQKLDVPFIAMYRKEEILSLLKDLDDVEAGLQTDSNRTPKLKWHKVLWTIRDLDRKWLLLVKRKDTLQSYYNKRYEEETQRVYDKTRLNLNQQIYESISMSLKAADSETEVDDIDSKFSLHFPPDEVLHEGLYKRPKRKSYYSVCNNAGLWEVANRFGYSSEKFGLQISLEKTRMDELEDTKEAPEEMASNFKCEMFKTPLEKLQGARHMVSVEISCEPSVRKHLRGIFMDNAVVSTRPTPDGNVAIHSFHQFSGVKWLRDKPLSRFEDAQWLLIQKAEEEKLLQVTVRLPETVLDKLLSDSRDYYLSDGVSKSAQSWNEQRKQILHDAFYNILLPSMEKEARYWLTSRAKTWLLWEYGKLLWDKVSVAPYQRKANDFDSDEEAVPRVLACCWGPGKPATTFVMLDSSGEIVDALSAGCFNLRGQSINDLQRKKNDQQRVQKFMMDHQPHVVVLGAANLSCTRLKEDIYEIIFKMVEDNQRNADQKIDSLNIIYADESLPLLYENSRVSVDQLPSQEGIIRRAVALGRYLQNPLAMVATLCGPGREILSWKLSPLVKFLTPDEKYWMVEQVMVDATNQVGLDVNLASSHEWLFSPLQFISGLGPRKTASLQRSLVRAGAIFTRKDLLTSHGLGKKVFINAVGFLRVRRSGLSSSSSQFIDLLDDTRIHPESYSLAQDFAKDVYHEDVNHELDDDDDDLLEMAIEHVREKPHLLQAVDAHEYAVQKNRLNKKETLNDIILELMDGFQERRKPHLEPNQDDEFYMIAGEAEETLGEGRIVQVTTRRVQADRAFCVLDSGLTGILSKEDYADDWRDINELTDKLHEGDIITCRIKSIQKNRYQVFLTCRESEMRSARFQNDKILDPYYQEELCTIQPMQEKTRKEKELAKKHFKPRMIVHPQFKNITADEALEFLRYKEAGESVIRPSSRGPSYLTLTLKVSDGVFADKDIIEGQKELKDITSLLQIGKTLKIGEDRFEDLDEVMDRYVDPLRAHLKTMLNYRKFKKGTKTEIDELLRIEKATSATHIVYCLGMSHEHPGTFILTYIRSANPHHEYIGLYPKGFKFRKRMFENVDRLVAYFQKHIDDPRNSGPTIRSAAASVTMKSPATESGDGWGGSNNDGAWRNSQFMDGDKTSELSSWGGRGDSQSGERGRGRGRGRGRSRGRGSYAGGRGDKQDSDGDSLTWGMNDGNGGDWKGGGRGSTGGWGSGSKSGGNWGGGRSGGDGGGDQSGNTGGTNDGNGGDWKGGGRGSTGGWGSGSKSGGNWGGGRSGGDGGGVQSGNAGDWQGGGGGSKSEGNWNSGKSGSDGGWGGGDGSGSIGGWVGSKSGGKWRGGGSGGEGGGGDQSGNAAGGWQGGGGGSKSDGKWNSGKSGSNGGWGGGDGNGSTGGWLGSKSGGNWRGGSGGEGGGGDQSGNAGGWQGGGGGSKGDGNWSSGKSGDDGGSGGGDRNGSSGGWGGSKSGGKWGGGGSGGGEDDQIGNAGGWQGGGGGSKSDDNWNSGKSGDAGGWGGNRSGGEGGGGDQSGNAGGWQGGSGASKSDGNWNSGKSGDAGGRNGSTGAHGNRVNDSWGGGGGDRSGSLVGWGGRGSESSRGWRGGGRDNGGGGWGGNHGASGGSRGGRAGSRTVGALGGGRSDNAGGVRENSGAWGGSKDGGGGSDSAGAWGGGGSSGAGDGSIRAGGNIGGGGNGSSGGWGSGGGGGNGSTDCWGSGGSGGSGSAGVWGGGGNDNAAAGGSENTGGLGGSKSGGGGSGSSREGVKGGSGWGSGSAGAGCENSRGWGGSIGGDGGSGSLGALGVGGSSSAGDGSGRSGGWSGGIGGGSGSGSTGDWGSETRSEGAGGGGGWGRSGSAGGGRENTGAWGGCKGGGGGSASAWGGGVSSRAGDGSVRVGGWGGGNGGGNGSGSAGGLGTGCSGEGVGGGGGWGSGGGSVGAWGGRKRAGEGGGGGGGRGSVSWGGGGELGRKGDDGGGAWGTGARGSATGSWGGGGAKDGGGGWGQKSDADNSESGSSKKSSEEADKGGW